MKLRKLILTTILGLCLTQSVAYAKPLNSTVDSKTNTIKSTTTYIKNKETYKVTGKVHSSHLMLTDNAFWVMVEPDGIRGTVQPYKILNSSDWLAYLLKGNKIELRVIKGTTKAEIISIKNYYESPEVEQWYQPVDLGDFYKSDYSKILNLKNKRVVSLYNLEPKKTDKPNHYALYDDGQLVCIMRTYKEDKEPFGNQVEGSNTINNKFGKVIGTFKFNGKDVPLIQAYLKDEEWYK